MPPTLISTHCADIGFQMAKNDKRSSNLYKMNMKHINMKTMSVEVNEEFAKALEEIEHHRDRQTFIKNPLFSGLKQYRIELAIKKYSEGKVSTWKSAEIAGIPLRKMNRILQEKGVEMHYSEKSLKDDLY